MRAAIKNKKKYKLTAFFLNVKKCHTTNINLASKLTAQKPNINAS